MPPSKRQKVSWGISWIIILIFFLYVAYCLSGLFMVPGVNLETYDKIALQLLTHPLEKSCWNDKSMHCLGVALFVWFLAALWHYSTLHDLRIGEEHGTSKWGSIKKINRRLASLVTCHFLCFSYKRPGSENRVLSESLRVSYDTKHTKLNNNLLVIGGSGSGKTAYVVIPNLLANYGSNVYTDPKGTLAEECGNYLMSMGRRVLSLNLVDMNQSCRYNPFRYLRKASDVNKLVTNLMANTTQENANHSDPFWEKAEKMYLSSIFFYVWTECPRKEHRRLENGVIENVYLDRTFRSVLHLLNEAKVNHDPEVKSPLDVRMNKLAREKGENHPAVRSYRRCVRGAGDTVRSIIVSANARFDPFDNEELLRILDGDDIDLPSLAAGFHGNTDIKTSLFCCIPDDDDTYNFIPGLLYTQLFQELYRQARLNGGKCPIPVGLWLDEFANSVTRSAPKTVGITDKSAA
ncbi:type IV secretory pathway TraG/TraD family ATPase VirD4 [Lachnospiraceae bacterium PF1-21]